MNREQHLLIKLMEECAEVSKLVSKSLIFGLDDHHPDRSSTNKEEICHELNDLYAVVEMLSPYLDFFVPDPVAMEEKKDKVNHYIKYSQHKGITQT